MGRIHLNRATEGRFGRKYRRRSPERMEINDTEKLTAAEILEES